VDGCLSSPVAYIEGLFIGKEYRNKGRGKAALELILSWCRKNGFTDIAADAELSNNVAQEFFKAVGFRETFRIVEYCRNVD